VVILALRDASDTEGKETGYQRYPRIGHAVYAASSLAEEVGTGINQYSKRERTGKIIRKNAK
jgi:hypothetical protein|tara:strand:- start:851 stop:1036 length:186 start_codon:yes stop_codon:yes gene_type:complete